MTPPARQLGLLLLLLTPVPAVTAFVSLSSELSDYASRADSTLEALVSGSLRGHDLLLVSDNFTYNILNLARIVAAAGISITPIFLATQDAYFHTKRPVHQTKGSLLTAIILFYDNPTAFLLLLEENKHWNPSYLVLFCLDPNLNTTAILAQPVVQRSQFILLLQPQEHKGRWRFLAYTSLLASLKSPLGVWSPSRFQTRQSILPIRFKDFGGKVLQVPIFCHDEPFLYLNKNGDCIGGNSDALGLIGTKHNFTHIKVPLKKLIWSVRRNGTWLGMLGELMYGGKDIMVSSMKLQPDVFLDFDFTYPYWPYNFAVVLRVPPPIPHWRNILYPFSKVMWGVVIGTTLVAAALLSFLLNWLFDVHDPTDIALKVVSGLLGQAMDDKRVRDYPWARVWLIFWWLSVDILAAAYMSNLMSVLTVPVYPHRIQTLQELADSSIIPSMVDYGSFVPQALKESDNPIYSTLGRKLYLDTILVLPYPFDFLLRKVMKGTHGIIVSTDYFVWTQKKKGLTEITYIMDERLYKDYMAWFLPYNTPYTPVISGCLQRIVETGILGKIYEQHVSLLSAKEHRVRGTGVLNLGHLQGAFIALGLGATVAAFFLLVESIAHRQLLPHLHHHQGSMEGRLRMGALI